MTNESPVELTRSLKDMLGADAEVVHREYEELYEWMLIDGKNPRRSVGLNQATAGNHIPRLDQIHRFILKFLNPDNPVRIADEDADEVLHMIDSGEITKQKGQNEEYSESSKRKFANALKAYFSWLYHEKEALDYEWEPKISFSDGKGESAALFTYHELGQLLDEAATYKTLPSYYSTTAEEREEINTIVAQRLGVSKEEVTRDHWLEADWSGKIHSLITVSYDAGLAPKEVARAETHWYDSAEQILRIPSEHACKERDKEVVAIGDQSAEALADWMQERRHLSKYDGTNRLWLNREGNPYQSGSLCNLLRNLCRQADIDIENRRVVWYSLRRTMGRNVTDAGKLSEASDQLRHERIETTQENYNRTPVERLQTRLTETHREAERANANPEYNPFEEDASSSHHNSGNPVNQERNTSSHAGSSSTNDAVSRTNGGAIHVDAVINDTTEAKVDITRQILDETDEDDQPGDSTHPV